MSLVPDYEDLSNDSDSSSSGDERKGEKSHLEEKLPVPKFLLNAQENTSGTQSVFTNPFTEAELAKRSILEKHVKMVNKQELSDIINGKKVCWNYRKGRCRFGNNCKFAHDSDLHKSKDELLNLNKLTENVIVQSEHLPVKSKPKDEKAVVINKKKRPGLTQGLVPGKKVMRTYYQQHKVP